ncbi:MAG: 30S ribosomal protein S7 [Candidatus Aenigmarchaeota archaeon]|nr:30S ribosomal protein S7 [Candidatus Aenigmarchaeota archaeon]
MPKIKQAIETKPRPKKQAKRAVKREKTQFSFKLFGKWEPADITNSSMRGYINMDPRFMPRSAGALRGRFHKSKMHIVERLALKLLVSGHTGKKHKLTSGKFGGGYGTVTLAVEKALEIIESKEKKNPLEVLAQAIENSALREEVISYQRGSIMAREAVVTSPQRRVDKTLRYFAQAAYRKSFNKNRSLAETLADELIAAYKGSADSFAIKEKERMEREASGAR